MSEEIIKNKILDNFCKNCKWCVVLKTGGYPYSKKEYYCKRFFREEFESKSQSFYTIIAEKCTRILAKYNYKCFKKKWYLFWLD